MLYHPEGQYVWDTWYYISRGQVHCIHLQVPRPNSPCSTKTYGSLGHAISDDLVHWHDYGIALYAGEQGSCDDDALWTGCVEEKDGKYYMYYTARTKREGGQVNRIALAVSDDGETWEKWKDNPIMIPDSRWYANEFKPMEICTHGYPIVDCRDMCVVKDPENSGWWGFFAVRRHASVCAESSVIGLAHSDDLIHWEQYPPCFCPKYLACVEVPEVFFLNGRWYMLCLTGNSYGQRGCTSDLLVNRATVYAVSDHLCGPYHMDDRDNVLLGSVGQQGYSCKTLLWQGHRTLFYTQGEEKAGCPHGSISRPQLVDTDEAGHLRLKWHPACNILYQETSLGDFEDVSGGHWGSIGEWETGSNHVFGRCDGDWAVLPWKRRFEDGWIEFSLTLKDAHAAGICLRLRGNDIMQGGLVILLDAVRKQIILTAVRNFPVNEARSFPVDQSRTYRLRVMMTGYVLNVYVDDVLWIQCYEPCARTGRPALYVEHGAASFENIRAKEEIRSTHV